jgi:hypothetical protein
MTHAGPRRDKQREVQRSVDHVATGSIGCGRIGILDSRAEQQDKKKKKKAQKGQSDDL